MKSVFKFNTECKNSKGVSLIEQGYSDERECAFPIEEMLEGFVTTELAHQLNMDEENPSPKDISRFILNLTINEGDLSDVDRLDKHIDAIIFCLGSIYKLGLTPQQTARAIDVVANANLAKLTAGQDSNGKQQKPDGFVGPEEQLQLILDERK